MADINTDTLRISAEAFNELPADLQNRLEAERDAYDAAVANYEASRNNNQTAYEALGQIAKHAGNMQSIVGRADPSLAINAKLVSVGADLRTARDKVATSPNGSRYADAYDAGYTSEEQVASPVPSVAAREPLATPATLSTPAATPSLSGLSSHTVSELSSVIRASAESTSGGINAFANDPSRQSAREAHAASYIAAKSQVLQLEKQLKATKADKALTTGQQRTAITAIDNQLNVLRPQLNQQRAVLYSSLAQKTQGQVFGDPIKALGRGAKTGVGFLGAAAMAGGIAMIVKTGISPWQILTLPVGGVMAAAGAITTLATGGVIKNITNTAGGLGRVLGNGISKLLGKGKVIGKHETVSGAEQLMADFDNLAAVEADAAMQGVPVETLVTKTQEVAQSAQIGAPEAARENTVVESANLNVPVTNEEVKAEFDRRTQDRRTVRLDAEDNDVRSHLPDGTANPEYLELLEQGMNNKRGITVQTEDVTIAKVGYTDVSTGGTLEARRRAKLVSKTAAVDYAALATEAAGELAAESVSIDPDDMNNDGLSDKQQAAEAGTHAVTNAGREAHLDPALQAFATRASGGETVETVDSLPSTKDLDAVTASKGQALA